MLVLVASRRKPITDYEWYRFQGTRTAKFFNHHREFDLDIERNAVFGILPVRKDVFYVIDKDDPDIIFRLNAREVGLLLKKSVGYKGKVQGKSVQAGVRGKDGKAIPKAPGAKAPAAIRAAGREDKTLTTQLSNAGFNAGLKRLRFLDRQEPLPGEVYHFYDATSALRSYRRKHGLKTGEYGKFYTELEDFIEQKFRNLDAEVATVKFKGEVTTVLSILRLE